MLKASASLPTAAAANLQHIVFCVVRRRNRLQYIRRCSIKKFPGTFQKTFSSAHAMRVGVDCNICYALVAVLKPDL
jgi:hypothetical protein